MTRTLLRPTGFVDSPFGHDGKVARLAGGLNWFASVELITVDGHSRTATELVPVEGIENRFDDDMAAQWTALTAPRAPLQLGTRTIRLDQPQVMGIVNATPDSFSDGGQFADAECRGRGRRRHGARRRRDYRCRRRIDPPGRAQHLGRRRDRAHRADHPPACRRRRGGLGRYAQGRRHDGSDRGRGAADQRRVGADLRRRARRASSPRRRCRSS